MKRFGIILAAGKGTRMKSSLYKVLHPVCGKPMVEHVVEKLEKANADEIVSIVGCGAEMVQDVLGDRCQYALQEEQLGTGHAVLQAEGVLGDKEGTTIVLCGDTPLITEETINQLIKTHQKLQAKATILTGFAENPTGYGRVIRSEDGYVVKNVEQKDATPEEQLIQEVNTGTYCFDNQTLFEALHRVGNDNAQGEYYLPDVLEIIKKDGGMVAAYQMSNFDEGLGVNDRIALSKAEKIMRQRINQYHMMQGVTLIDPETTYIEDSVMIGSDTVIEPNVILKGHTKIGSNCFIGAHSVISHSILEDNIRVISSNLEDSVMKKGSNIGPFAHLRPKAEIGENVHIGNFVEVKNASLAQGTKVGHLTYVGDADLGQDINVGCGTIFVNYDGKNKHRSKIGDGVFIGCNANIIAPVSVGNHAFIAAGSTITKDVPEEALAIGRSRQEIKEKYANKLPGMKK
ncbi:UDP-N-acetylglucosamine pyrophosphorylase /glucosamine-1-phosphate N-acetyltransferase [Granulicatella balaenopterae]|uniref:Bifunctional protein GlmU n=1 Tax=Granulicatella balaenopterae TaxID=137733 RepID=A0A1H9JD43_9LACT|nr:UDP-N-acetylglucosamine pyrophosphorylase /glucosamine-1-phosphate N-acetyltransferase [Granulicatella balaenopterae]